MSAADLYRENVLAHNRAPRNHGTLDTHTHAADGANPLCGDSLRMELAVDEGRIVAFAFSGESCAITIATASMLGERVQGLDASQIDALRREFEALLRGDACDRGLLGELAAFGELVRYPARRKCAQLPWATLAAALDGQTRATTEKDPT